jgi:prevent-host-death family protein
MKRSAARPIQEVAISEFKAKCLALLENVRKTKTPIRVTRRGKPVADVIPATEGAENSSWIGSMKGLMEITGDIVSPVIDLDDIEAMKE